jgi:tetratricopeptide (TPR) repeat protein
MMAHAYAQALAPDFLTNLIRQVVGAFFAYPEVMSAIGAMALAALMILTFWFLRGLSRGAANARIAMRSQQLRKQKDHRAMILIAYFDGVGGHNLREQIRQAIAGYFGDFAFQAPVQVELFPLRLPLLPARANLEKRRRLAVAALEALEKASGDVIVWGARNPVTGRCDVRMTAAPLYGHTPELHAIDFNWRPGGSFDGLDQAVTYAAARRARPVLNRPQDYKPEKLQPIVDALDKLVSDPPQSLCDAAQLEILSDYASGALSLGERGGDARWLEKALDARRMFLDKVDRTSDPGAWGAAQQEVGRALAALGERQADRGKLEEAVNTLKQSLDALRATESLQAAEVAMRALQRAEQTLSQRRRINLRWPVQQ